MSDPLPAPYWRAWPCVVYILAALVGLDVLVAANGRRWRAYDPDDYQERVTGCRREQSDLVLIGGSPVSEGCDPAVLAGVRWRGKALPTAYNLGLLGATTSEFWHAVEHGVRKPPRLLVYGVTASDLNDGRDEPHGPRSLMDASDMAVWMRARPAAAAWCVRQYLQGRVQRLWSLYAYRNGIRLWAADQAERLCPGAFSEAAAEARHNLCFSAALHADHGFAPTPGFQTRNLAALKAAHYTDPVIRFMDGYHLGGHLSYLYRLLDWADAHGVAVVLVDMPVSADLEERFYPREFAAYRAALAEVERTRSVVVLRPTREAVGLTELEFADMIHLNARGSARFSAWLRQQLEQM